MSICSETTQIFRNQLLPLKVYTENALGPKISSLGIKINNFMVKFQLLQKKKKIKKKKKKKKITKKNF